MRTPTIIAAAFLLLTAAAAGAIEPGMGTSAGHDLDALWARAQETVDLDTQDAVILLDSRTTTVGDEGTVAVRVHQVVWIATSRGIRGYADLRVPWNAATSTLEVEKLRTWRDGRWWPDPEEISDTAVVETLPYAVDHADDYTTLRETMLLHDGVELPCIMETAYTIAVQGPPDAGADDVYVFPQRDPVVHSEYVVRVPVGTELKWEAPNGAPAPAVTENGVREFAWTVEGAGALRLPLTSQPEAYEPAVVWSTWESWESLLGQFAEAVDAAAVLDEALADSVAAVTAGVPAGVDREEAVLAFLDRSVRPIHTDILPFLLAPRSAARTYATGYGHALDRAVLATALLRNLQDVGVTTAPVRDEPFGRASGLPRLADVDGILVGTDAADGPRWTDPSHGKTRFVTTEGRALLGRDEAPATATREFTLDVSLVAIGDVWEGEGVLHLAGEPTFPDAPLADLVETIVGSVLDDAAVADVRATLPAAGLRARFALSLPAPAARGDDDDRLVVGSPGRGLAADVRHSVNLADEHRGSPLPRHGAGRQQVVVRLRVGDGGLRAAGPVDLANAAGRLVVRTARDGEWFTYTRRLELGDAADIPWPDLRALLLEEQDPANGTIVLEKAK